MLAQRPAGVPLGKWNDILMNNPQPAPGQVAPDSTGQDRNWPRRLVNVLVAIGVIAVAGATFVFSYAGVHAIALLGGVSAPLARYYPGLFDAVLVIACVAAVMLRDGRWWMRLWAWLVIVIVLGSIGTADVLHAMSYTLRHRPTEGVVAAAPVVAVLLAFSLLLTLITRRQSKAWAASAPVGAPPTVPVPVTTPPGPVPGPAVPAAIAPPTVPVPVPTEPVPAPAPFRVRGPAGGPEPEEEPEPEEAPVAEDAVEPAPPTAQVPAVPRRHQGIRYAGGGPRNTPPKADYWEAEGTEQFAGLVYRARDEDDNDSVPQLNRVRSTPTPPADEDE